MSPLRSPKMRDLIWPDLYLTATTARLATFEQLTTNFLDSYAKKYLREDVNLVNTRRPNETDNNTSKMT